MNERHRLVSEIPEREEAVITIPVALVLLSERYAVDSVHRRVAQDAEPRKSDVDFHSWQQTPLKALQDNRAWNGWRR